jgi:hypothetical protein
VLANQPFREQVNDFRIHRATGDGRGLKVYLRGVLDANVILPLGHSDRDCRLAAARTWRFRAAI